MIASLKIYAIYKQFCYTQIMLPPRIQVGKQVNVVWKEPLVTMTPDHLKLREHVGKTYTVVELKGADTACYHRQQVSPERSQYMQVIVKEVPFVFSAYWLELP